MTVEQFLRIRATCVLLVCSFGMSSGTEMLLGSHAVPLLVGESSELTSQQVYEYFCMACPLGCFLLNVGFE